MAPSFPPPTSKPLDTIDPIQRREYVGTWVQGLQVEEATQFKGILIETSELTSRVLVPSFGRTMIVNNKHLETMPNTPRVWTTDGEPVR